MTTENIKMDEALLAMMQQSNHNWGRLSHMSRKLFEEWALHELSMAGYPDFKIGYMPFLMNIHPLGETNNEVAKKAKVSKQAMSKVVKELEKLGLISSRKDNHDRRATKIFMTEEGKTMVYESKMRMQKLTEAYIKRVGEQNFNIAMDVLNEIVGYHEDLNRRKP